MDGGPRRFAAYVALGDSMSMDVYPAQELGPAASTAAVGAASLFHRNVDDLWPEFAGQDLVSRHDGIAIHDLTVDGATAGDVMARQLPALKRIPDIGDRPSVVTLTAGGNDLIHLLLTVARDQLDRAAAQVPGSIAQVVRAVRDALPQSLLLLTTTYDPTDGTGELPGLSEEFGRLPVELLESCNEQVRTLAAATPGVVLADAHQHFLGHGVSAPRAERWYWSQSMIEPGLTGASELRRVWLASSEFGEPESAASA